MIFFVSRYDVVVRMRPDLLVPQPIPKTVVEAARRSGRAQHPSSPPRLWSCDLLLGSTDTQARNAHENARLSLS